MMKQEQLKGIMVPVVTPFQADGNVDFDSLERHVRHLLNCGIEGIIVNGTTGESPTTTADELRRITAVVQSAASKEPVPLVIGSGTNDTASTVSRTEEAGKLGADAALVVVPYYNRPSQRGIIEHFRRVAQVGVPIIMYDIPYRTGVHLTVDTVRTILDIDGVIGMKDSTGGIGLVSVLSRFDTKPVMCGEDVYLYASLCCGAAGGILASANVETERFVQLYRSFAAGRPDEAKRLFDDLLPLIRLLFAEPNPAPLKWLLARRGCIVSDSLRLPMTQISTELGRRLEAFL